MLDVHPPHAATHTWRDFFIHIATITVGLLIAVGIEQIVEHVHQRRQVVELREALHQESESNHRIFATRTENFRVETKRMQTSLAVLVYLRDHPRVQLSELPGTINWHGYVAASENAVWTSAQNGTVITLMPPNEVRRLGTIYKQLERIDRYVYERQEALQLTRRYMALDSDPTHLRPADLETAIRDTEMVISRQYRLGSEMRNLHGEYSDFQPAPVTNELLDLMHEPRRPEPTSAPSSSAQPAEKP